MNTPESLREFTGELILRGLPAEYARRAAEELADHHRDLTEEWQTAGMDETAAIAAAIERLGETKSLVKKTVRDYQRRHWCGRWRVVTFLFVPLVLLVAAWIGSGLGLMLLGKTLEAIGIESPSKPELLTTGVYLVMYSFIGWYVFVLPMAVLLFLSRRASRAGLSWRWMALSALVLALNVGSMKFGFVGPLSGFTDATTGQALAPDRIVVSLPLYTFFSTPGGIISRYASDPQLVCQLLLPLAVAALLIWRAQRRTRQWELDLTAC